VSHLLADRYELSDLLGSGGMGEVRRAWDTRLRRHVAIKLFRPGSEPADARRFDNEIRTLAALSHPGLVSVYDAETTGDTPFVVLQLVEGPTLRDRIAGGPLSTAEVRRIGAELADALTHVHSHGVVHRDIKPSNILIDTADNVHLADFGLARLTGSTRLTRGDQLVGTAAYLAPEQVRGEEIGSPVDVYALGLVLLECLTGEREYQGGEIEAAVARLHRQPAVPGDLPADMVRLLTLMTSLSPRRRPTAAHCAQALRETPTLVEPLPRPRRRARLVAASAVTVLLTAAGVTTAALLSPPPLESAPPPTVAPTSPPTTQTVPPTTGQATAEVPPPAQANVTADDDQNSGPGKGGRQKQSGKGKGKSP
jgi:eukaryotic-like serine/threonine-protein kinase